MLVVEFDATQNWSPMAASDVARRAASDVARRRFDVTFFMNPAMPLGVGHVIGSGEQRSVMLSPQTLARLLNVSSAHVTGMIKAAIADGVKEGDRINFGRLISFDGFQQKPARRSDRIEGLSRRIQDAVVELVQTRDSGGLEDKDIVKFLRLRSELTAAFRGLAGEVQRVESELATLTEFLEGMVYES